MKRILRISFVLLFFTASSVLAVQKAVVIVPVADLRSDQSLPDPGKSDDKQLTQLLFGETVDVVQSSGDWVYVNAIEQPSFKYHQKWEGYPGWVRRDTIRIENSILHCYKVTNSTWSRITLANSSSDIWVPLGSMLRAAFWSGSERLPLRNDVISVSKLFLGSRYLWGGLTATPSPKSSDMIGFQVRNYGVDCSGLTHLAYRVYGITIPRDSMEQYMKAEKIKRAELKPADLIFSSKIDNPKKITHVALYAGNDQIIEAPQAGMVVRQVSFKEKYGKDFSQVESGDTVGERVIYFGRFLKD